VKVAIVGAGIIGLATAYHLLKDGHEVTLIDAAHPGSGASLGNAGWIVPAEVGPVAAPGMVLQGLKWMLRKDSPLYVQPSLRPDFVTFMVALARRSNRRDFREAMQANLALAEGTLGLLDDYLTDGMRFEMHAEGLLLAFATQGNFQHHQDDLDLANRFGLDPQVLTGEQVAGMEPALKPSLAGGLYFPHERHLRPDQLVGGLTDRCRALGATFLDQAPLTAVRRDANVLALVTPAGEVTADQYVLAAGAHSGPLSRLFGAPMPIRPGKGYSVDYRPAPVQLRAAVNLCDAKVAVTPLDGQLRLAGTMEFAGLDANVNPMRVSAIRRAPTRYFSHWDEALEPSAAAWAGARPMTPDGLPVLGRLPGLSNGWVAAGHGMLGVTLGPGTGLAIATAIGTGSAPKVLRPFDPVRFQSVRGRAVVYPRRLSLVDTTGTTAPH
jgi:D-amino-acid dehydrogenase